MCVDKFVQMKRKISPVSHMHMLSVEVLTIWSRMTVLRDPWTYVSADSAVLDGAACLNAKCKFFLFGLVIMS